MARFLTLPIQYDRNAWRILYIRAHVGSSSKNVNKAQWPGDRTIFMVNEARNATKREIVLLFKSCETIEKVVF